MRKLREILRLRLEQQWEGRAIARSVHASPSTVSDYLARAAVAGLTSWPLPPTLDSDEALDALLFPSTQLAALSRPPPDFAHLHRELLRPSVTKLLLWQEYKAQHPDGFQYSQFCERYSAWARPLGATLRQTHRAGEKLFVDFSGDGLPLVDPHTGVTQQATLFVAVLGASNLTYVEPVLTEALPTWIGCHVRALTFFGGVPALWVPDNLRSGVTRADTYEPELNPTYLDLARHYGAAILPARKRKPRDKAKVEQGVLLAERWILAVLRHRRFASLEEFRAAVRPLVQQLNDRPMRRLGQSRRQLFEAVERAALRPLPATTYEFAEWRRPQVNRDYHVEFDQHFYSVPHALIGQRVDLRVTERCLEVFLAGRRVASHVRSREAHGTSTLAEHQPTAHRAYVGWTPAQMLAWGQRVGTCTVTLLQKMLTEKAHPEQGLRAGLGVLRLGEQYTPARLERACERALTVNACSYKSVQAILVRRLDEQPREVAAEEAPPTLHENVRGPDYYH